MCSTGVESSGQGSAPLLVDMVLGSVRGVEMKEGGLGRGRGLHRMAGSF